MKYEKGTCLLITGSSSVLYLILQIILLFILKISLCDDPLYILTNGFTVLLVQLIHVNGLAIFDHYGGLFYFGEMVLKNVAGVYDGHGDDGDAALVCNLEAAVVEGQEGVRGLVAGALGEDADGDAAFYFFDGFQNGLQAFLDIVAVQEETVEIAHPYVQQRPFFIFFFGDIAGEAGDSGVSQDDVKEASVVGDVENRRVCRDILFSQDIRVGTADPNENPEGPLHDSQGTFILQGGIKFADDPFGGHERYGQY